MNKSNNSIPSGNKKKITDLMLNIGAVVIMNCVLQFLLYPRFEKILGVEKYGVALTLMAIISITACSFGSAGNYSRLINENEHKPSNGDYVVLLLLSSIVSVAVGLICLHKLQVLTWQTGLFYSLLIVATAFKYYSDVGFKIKADFVRYFFYYLFISIGYFAGLFIFNGTGDWMLAILAGEILGVFFAIIQSKIFVKPFSLSKNFKFFVSSFAFLVFSNLIENLTLNADRLVLMIFAGGESVAVYYTASLFGKIIAMLTVPINSVVITYLVRYNGELTRKMWFKILAVAVGLSALCFLGCYVGSIIILPHVYPDLYVSLARYLLPAIGAQVIYFVSTVLLVVLLKFRGEKKQFVCNIIYGVIFFASTLTFTYLYKLEGFVISSLVANAIRFIYVSIWGFVSKKPIVKES